MKVQFYPIDIDYVISGEKTIVRLFGRTTNRERICVFDDSFKPYFWIIPRENIDTDDFIRKIKDIRLKEKDRTITILDAKLENKKYLEQDIKAIKVILNHPSDVPIVKDRIKLMHETLAKKEIDIPFYKRYLIDKTIIPLVLCEAEGEEIETNLEVDLVIKADYIKQIGEEVIKDPRILAFDIEVYNVRRTPIEDKDAILMISFAGSDGLRKIITWKKFTPENKNIEFVEDEGNLILRFKDFIKEYKPDYLVSYFGDGFDFPYIRARASVYNIKLDLGLDKSMVKFSRRTQFNTAKLKGFAHIDIFKFIKGIMGVSIESENYDLSSIASELIKDKKEEIDIWNLYKAWDNNKDLERFCNYNLHDAEMTLKLAENVLPNLNELVKLVGMPIQDLCRMSYGQLVEWYLVKQVKEFNEICPNRPTYETIAKRQKYTYEGAFVFEPTPGLYENIAVFDFRSLYPTIITAHNICPSTLTKNKKNSYASPEIGKEKKRFYFTTKKEGFIPKILKDILTRRIRIKEMLKNNYDPILDARQETLKILANSFYGYLGFFGARYYSIECAQSITAFGRDYIQKVIRKAQENFKVIYADTDAVFFTLENKKEKDALDFLENVNRELPSLMELELENFYPRGIFVMKKANIKGAKKKYALIDKEDNIKVIGFESVRRDWSILAREVQNKVFEIILKENNVEKALDYVKEMIKKVREKKIEKEKLILQTQLKKDIDDYESIGPHVAIAKKMRQKDLIVGPGSIISYIITEGKGLIRDKARMPEETEDYDAEYYVNNQIVPAVARIFEVLGFKGIAESHEQSKLKDFN